MAETPPVRRVAVALFEGFTVLDVYGPVQAFAACQGIILDPVKFMPYERIERLFLPVFLPALPAKEQRDFRALLLFARYININRPFPSMPDTDARRLGLGLAPGPAEVLERNLAFLWDTHLSGRGQTA